jgi:hypothetical protein
MNQPKTIYLKDYKPSAFFIDSINLQVDIYDHKTFVHSVLKIQKSQEQKGKASHLELNGENMTLKSIKLNGVELSADLYQVSSDKLVILNVIQDEFELQIENEIDPANNKACEGFYQSGDQFCTQCEPEGFRKITYFIDRPDVQIKKDFHSCFQMEIGLLQEIFQMVVIMLNGKILLKNRVIYLLWSQVTLMWPEIHSVLLKNEKLILRSMLIKVT